MERLKSVWWWQKHVWNNKTNNCILRHSSTVFMSRILKVLKPIEPAINDIRVCTLSYRQFWGFIEEIWENDLPYYTAIRWLSWGKVMTPFFCIIIDNCMIERNRLAGLLTNIIATELGSASFCHEYVHNHLETLRNLLHMYKRLD